MYSSYLIRQEKIFGQLTLQQLRERKPIEWETIEKLHRLLDCQPGDIIEYAEEEDIGQTVLIW